MGNFSWHLNIEWRLALAVVVLSDLLSERLPLEIWAVWPISALMGSSVSYDSRAHMHHLRL